MENIKLDKINLIGVLVSNIIAMFVYHCCKRIHSLIGLLKHCVDQPLIGHSFKSHFQISWVELYSATWVVSPFPLADIIVKT